MTAPLLCITFLHLNRQSLTSTTDVDEAVERARLTTAGAPLALIASLVLGSGHFGRQFMEARGLDMIRVSSTAET